MKMENLILQSIQFLLFQYKIKLLLKLNYLIKAKLIHINKLLQKKKNKKN